MNDADMTPAPMPHNDAALPPDNLPDVQPDALPEPIMDEPHADHVLLLCVDETLDNTLADALRILARRADFAVHRHALGEDSPPEIDARHYVCLFAHAHSGSLALLRYALHSPARYIGLVGPEGTTLLDALRAEGVPPAELACLRCPAGLPIGAVSTQEHAVSLMAEIIAARAGRMPRHATR